ncbi:MAG: hypothetical protein ACRD3C_11115 [Vicinamibacterales bacterium]
MLQRIAAAFGGGSVPERLATLERVVRKLGETDRHGLAALDRRLTDLVRAVDEQPTAKDLRELRQAVRGATIRQPVQWLFEAIDQIVSAGRPILIGPWTGEVGFELLYWIPYIRWVRAHWNLPPEREVIVSRGGVASWYGQDAPAYTDILALCTPEEFRCAVAEEKRKHRKPGAFDDRIVEAVVRRRDGAPVDVLHPGLMHRLFAPYWSDEAGYALIDQFTRHQLIEPPGGLRPPDLPADYVAVRFYFNECFPATPENQAFARSVVSSLAERTAVVILNPGFSVDDHSDWLPDGPSRMITIADIATPQNNLALQGTVIAGARAFVGTYGGYSYLAPLYRVPALAFYSKPSFKLHHLYAAQRAFGQIGAGALMPVDVAQAGVVQLALGALVPA